HDFCPQLLFSIRLRDERRLALQRMPSFIERSSDSGLRKSSPDPSWQAADRRTGSAPLTPREPLLFFAPRESPTVSVSRVIATYRLRGLKRLSRRRTLMDVIGRLRITASIPFTRAPQKPCETSREPFSAASTRIVVGCRLFPA